MKELVQYENGKRIIRLVGGFDIGNGYTKCAVRNKNADKADGGKIVTEIDMPSCVSVVSHPQDLKPEGNEVAGVVANMFEEMDVVIGSHMVSEKRRLYVGSRGVSSGVRPFEFNVGSHLSKANDPLSVILLLSCIAGKAVQDLYQAEGRFPTDVTVVEAEVALALPIREYVKYGVTYRENLMKQPHMVTVHNFEQDVVFQVCLTSVAIVPEGAAAQYAIVDKGEVFMNAVLAYARKAMLSVYGQSCQKNMLFEVTAQDVLSSLNTVGIDIGEGTVNFPVFRNGQFAADVSSNLNIGYGSVLSDALNEMSDKGYPFQSRKEVTEYLNKVPTRMQRPMYDEVNGIVQNHVTNLVESINVEFTTAMNKAGAIVEVVYVYGGGASPIQNELYRKLIDNMRTNQRENVLLLYLDSSWSRNLNREGLLVAAEARSAALAQKKQPVATETKK